MNHFSKLFCFISLFISFASFGQSYIIKTHFDTKNIPLTPDYSNDSSWAALPSKTDYADKTPSGLKNNQDSALADVFFIYPTTYTDKPTDTFKWNADIHNQQLNHKTESSTIQYQASIFNGSCKVYAPYYRQAHYTVFLTHNDTDNKQAFDVAYADVKASFEYYLLHYNNNRPIIIASHSQGTIHAVRLLQEFFMNQPFQQKLVVAYLVGMPVPTDSLPLISPCKDGSQTNCFTCWNTFEKNYIPTYYSKGLINSVCTNPISWTLDENYVAATSSKGAVVRPFDKVRPQLCDAQVHQGLLWTTKPKFPGSFVLTSSVYHAGDYNLFYMDIRENVALRIKSYFKNQ